MLFSDQLAANDTVRYLAFKARHPLGDTTEYFRYVNNGRMTDDELAVKTAYAAIQAHGSNLDRGEVVYAEAVARGFGTTREAANLRAQLDHAIELFQLTTQGMTAAEHMARETLEVDMGAGLSAWGDWGLILTGVGLVAAAVVTVLFLPEVAAAAALVAAVAVVIGSTGALLTLIGAVGASGASGSGLIIAAVVGLGLVAFMGAKRGRGGG